MTPDPKLLAWASNYASCDWKLAALRPGRGSFSACFFWENGGLTHNRFYTRALPDAIYDLLSKGENPDFHNKEYATEVEAFEDLARALVAYLGSFYRGEDAVRNLYSS